MKPALRGSALARIAALAAKSKGGTGNGERGDFRAAFKAECVTGSAIAPSLFDAAVQFTEEERGGEVHDLLGWKYARFGHQVPHSFGSFGGFYQESGELWQGKAEHWPSGFDGKYAARKGVGAKAFLPPVTIGDWVAVAKASKLYKEVPAWVRQAHESGLSEIKSGKGASENCAIRLKMLQFLSFSIPKLGLLKGGSKLALPLILNALPLRQICQKQSGCTPPKTPETRLNIKGGMASDIASESNLEVNGYGNAADSSTPEIESFWAWLAEHPEIPIILTEGGKKALCGISHGYVVIAGFGVDAFSRKGEYQLLPELRQFCHPERRWIIALDEDAARKTRRKVRAATSRLGRYLIEAGNDAQHISIAQWEPAQGKGLDDLVVQSGAEALHQAIGDAMPFPAWKRGGWDSYLRAQYPEIFGLNHEPEITLNQRYLPSLQLPQAGGILAISSPMGTGKTEVMKGLIAQARALDPDCLIELIGYRNSLGKQSAKRLHLDHIHDLEGDVAGQAFLNQSDGLAYCLDSLHRRIQRVLRAINSGRKCLILLDEIDAVLKHLFLGGTLGKRRAEIMLMLCELLQAVSHGGGWIICGEADLTSLPVAFLEAITGKSAQVVVNQYRGNPWEIEAMMPLSPEYKPAPHLMGKAAAARILMELARGKRVVVPSDSQRWGEQLARMAISNGYEVIRLDGSTSEESWAHRLMADPDAYLAQEKPQLFIYSTTAESGLSITGNHFDSMIAYGSHLEHRALIQLMGRIRPNIPRAVYCREFSLSDESGRASDPDALLKDWQLNARYSAMAARIGDDAPDLDLDGLEHQLHSFAARYQARINADAVGLRGNLLATLEAQGHTITHDEDDPLSEQFSEDWAEIRADIEVEQAEKIATADISEMSLGKAHRIISSSSSKREDRVKAGKVITLDSYPNLPMDDADFVLRNLVKSRGRNLRAHTALFLAQNPEVAREIDRVCWQQQATNQMIWLPSIKREAPKATLLQQSGLLELLELKAYRENHPLAQRVRSFAIKYQADIKRVLGLWCSESHTAIEIVNKLARRLGHKAKILRKQGSRGAQIKIWHWSDEGKGDRTAIHESLRQKWAAFISNIAPVASISDSNSAITKIESTDLETLSQSSSQPPPDLPPKPPHEYVGAGAAPVTIAPPPPSPNEAGNRRVIA